MTMNFLGAYDENATYQPGDVVVDQGGLYILAEGYENTTGQSPSWARMFNWGQWVPLAQGAY